MKFTISALIVGAALFATAAAPTRARIPVHPQRGDAPAYSVVELSGFGQPMYATATGINDVGWTVGDADLTGDKTEHASLWRDGKITDLGTLGGLNSSVNIAGRTSIRGLIAGSAQTSHVDPLHEDWGLGFTCSPAGARCRGYRNLNLPFVWRNGKMSHLPTLGGNNGTASGYNNRGQIAGFAENVTKDPTCGPTGP